jgi:hypothetical protein
MNKDKKWKFYNVLAIMMVVFFSLSSFVLGDEIVQSPSGGTDLMPTLALIFWFIFWVIICVILIEVIVQAFKRKNWWVCLPGTTKLVSLGQFAYQLKLANNFYLFNFNKVNETRTLEKKKKKKKEEEEESEDEENPDRGYVEIEKIETPTTIYCRYPIEYIFSHDGGVIWQYHRICHLFKLIELELPEHLEIYNKVISKKIGSRIRYALYKFPVQYLPGIRNAWFKWVLKKMVKGERLTKVPFLVFTLMEERYFNLYSFNYRKIFEDFKPINERYSSLNRLKHESSEVLESINSSQNSFLCEKCEECKLLDDCFKELGVNYSHKNIRKILKKSKDDVEYIKLDLELNTAVFKTYKIDETQIEEEDLKKIKTQIKKMVPIEKYRKVRNFICKDYDKKYKIKFVGTKTIVPENEKDALEKQEAREQIMASHVQKTFNYTENIKQLGKDNLDLKQENLKLYATIEKQIATSLGDMKDEMPDLKKYLERFFKVARLGYKDFDSIGQFLLKTEGGMDVKVPNGENASVNPENGKRLELENQALKAILQRALSPQEYNTVLQMLKESDKVAYYSK